MQKLFVIFTIFLSVNFAALAHEFNVEIGRIKTSSNRFQIPNDKANEVRIPDDEYQNSQRLKGVFDLKNDRFLYFLYAPFESEYDFKSGNSFKFNNSNFSANSDTSVSYRFSSYRVGYFKKFKQGKKLNYWLGGVLKIRDAKIEVRQGAKKDAYRNFGLVPLIGLGVEYFIGDKISLFSHIDSLGFDQGYAYDANAEIRYYVNKKNSFGMGYRTFGGGVDNDELLNFARFESFYVNYSKIF